MMEKKPVPKNIGNWMTLGVVLLFGTIILVAYLVGDF